MKRPALSIHPFHSLCCLQHEPFRNSREFVSRADERARANEASELFVSCTRGTRRFLFVVLFTIRRVGQPSEQMVRKRTACAKNRRHRRAKASERATRLCHVPMRTAFGTLVTEGHSGTHVCPGARWSRIHSRYVGTRRACFSLSARFVCAERGECSRSVRFREGPRVLCRAYAICL